MSQSLAGRTRLSQLDGHQARSWSSPWIWKQGQGLFSLCYFQSVLLPFSFCLMGLTFVGLQPQRLWPSSFPALLHWSGQCSCECGLVCGIPAETEVLVAEDQSGDRWSREKGCGFRGDLFADFRVLFSGGWQDASTEGALDSLMLGSWLDFRA